MAIDGQQRGGSSTTRALRQRIGMLAVLDTRTNRSVGVKVGVVKVGVSFADRM